MAVTKQGGHPSTATERLRAAREVKHDAIIRELCMASIVSRIWPSFLMPNRVMQQDYPWLLVIETPAGRLTYRVSDEELAAFMHLERKDANDGKPNSDKMSTLMLLATEGW